MGVVAGQRSSPESGFASKNLNQKLQHNCFQSMTLIARSVKWVWIVQHRTSDQYLTSVQV